MENKMIYSPEGGKTVPGKNTETEEPFDKGLQDFIDQNFQIIRFLGREEPTGEERRALIEHLTQIYRNQQWIINRFDEIRQELEHATPGRRASLYAMEHALDCPVTSRSVYSYAREFIPYNFQGDSQNRTGEIAKDLFPKDSGLNLNIGDAYRKIDQENTVSFDCRIDKVAKEKSSGRFVQGLFPDLPFKSDTFDRVVSVWTASLIMSKYDEPEFKIAIDELIRITRSGGKIFLSPFLWIDNEYLDSLVDSGLVEYEIIDQEDPSSQEFETYFALVIKVNKPELVVNNETLVKHS